ncbi:uncharacterized protein LOC106707157 [Latimeria chalumnae]|uniref:uncharacterized protein LOC106707157 n=1 Tax=Latimeria chalumnae TaxID=7897 RepID=UPI00313D67C6
MKKAFTARHSGKTFPESLRVAPECRKTGSIQRVKSEKRGCLLGDTRLEIQKDTKEQKEAIPRPVENKLVDGLQEEEVNIDSSCWKNWLSHFATARKTGVMSTKISYR